MLSQTSESNVLRAWGRMLASLIMVSLIVLGVVYPIFSLIAFGLLALYILLASSSDIFLILFFLMPFACIFKTAPSAASLFTYIQLVAMFKLVISRKKFEYNFLAVFAVMLVFLLAGSKGNYSILIKQVGIFLLFYLFFSDVKMDAEKFTLNYANGLLLSSVIALFNDRIPNMNEYIVNDMTFELERDVSRFSGLYSDPNYYSLALILALSAIMALYAYKLIGISAVGYYVVITFFGVQTVSKSFFLMLLFLTVFFLVCLLRNKQYKTLVFSLLALTVVGYFASQGRLSLFDNIIERLIFSNDSGDFTTGRVRIWESYMTYFDENPLKLFFGSGIGSDYLDGAPHNTYIDFLYYYGIVGSILFLIVLAIALVNIPKNKKTIVNFMPIVCVLISFFFLSNLMYYDLVYTLVFSAFIFNCDFRKRMV